ncbi:hypothetical protein Q9L58_005634 [Maublancomyces gigas]|uniref:Uncharacterized protein n=1 Tax=Discina gigas TaxID=1032678 RepID=A0ABR3GIN9_9PEZI
MSADLQELLLTPPALFLKMLEIMNLELASLHRSIVPALHRRIDDHSEGQCDEILVFIDDTELQLKMVPLLRDASGLMVAQFSETEMDYVETWLEMMTMFEEELKKAIEWLNDVLDMCVGPE